MSSHRFSEMKGFKFTSEEEPAGDIEPEGLLCGKFNPKKSENLCRD
jgi:hypothetical protein